MCLVGAAICASSLVAGAGFASAASNSAATAVKRITLNCKIDMTTVPPAGSNVVLVAPQGKQYGPDRCATAGFGSGIIANTFTVPDSGDTVGVFSQYFRAGGIFGKFDLTPLQGTGISPTSFQSQAWTGTVTVTGGTGIYSGITHAKGKKGIGRMHCTSPDSVHLSCTDSVNVVLPAGFKS